MIICRTGCRIASAYLLYYTPIAVVFQAKCDNILLIVATFEQKRRQAAEMDENNEKISEKCAAALEKSEK